MAVQQHHPDCAWHVEQYPQDCTCGATAPKHPDFDAYAEECRRARAEATTTEIPDAEP